VAAVEIEEPLDQSSNRERYFGDEIVRALLDLGGCSWGTSNEETKPLRKPSEGSWTTPWHEAGPDLQGHIDQRAMQR
jgi:hypothetical protein